MAVVLPYFKRNSVVGWL